MARISAPSAQLGDHVDWMMHRPEMAAGVGALAKSTYGHTQLPIREREAARYVIAQLNDCAVCKVTRAEGPVGDDEAFYAEVAGWRESEALTDRERLAAEFAERFVLDHHTMESDGFLTRLRQFFEDPEIADLTMCCGTMLGFGRMLAVMGVAAPEEALRL